MTSTMRLTAQLPLSSGSSPLRSRATVAAAPALLARFLDAAALSVLLHPRCVRAVIRRRPRASRPRNRQ
eukprot:4559940-Prymnesium_polylepis.1